MFSALRVNASITTSVVLNCCSALRVYTPIITAALFTNHNGCSAVRVQVPITTAGSQLFYLFFIKKRTDISCESFAL